MSTIQLDVEASRQAHADERAWPRPAYAWYVVVILSLAYVLSYVDRTIMSIVIEPVKAQLHLTDTQISLLVGFSFAALYAIAGVPFGWIADRSNRKRLINFAVTVWCFMTAICGWCTSFIGLFFARMGVGMGEAALYPAALSMIADYFAPAKRQIAVTAFVTGGVLGAAIAYLGGAAAIAFGTRLAQSGAELLGPHSGWQWAFIIVAAPGALLLLLFTTIREPVRRGLLGGSRDAGQGASMRVVGQFARQHWKTYACLFGGTSLMLIAAFGYTLWGISMFVRVHGWTQTYTATVFGPAVLALGVGGNILAVSLSRFLSKLGYTDAIMRACLIMACVALPLVVVGTLMPAPFRVIAIAFPGLGLLVGVATLAIIGVQVTVPNQLRGQFSAIFSLCANFLGVGVGPTFIALLTDYVYRDEARLHHSIATAAAIVIPIGIVVFALGLKHFRRSAEEARAWSES